jgi:hypothetical protein
MKQTSKEEIDALCKILDAVPSKGYESISEASKTAVEWLIFHWMELDKKYYGGEIGRIDYRNRRDSIQAEAKEMEEKQSQDYAAFCINCDRKNYPIVDFESYLKL